MTGLALLALLALLPAWSLAVSQGHETPAPSLWNHDMQLRGPPGRKLLQQEGTGAQEVRSQEASTQTESPEYLAICTAAKDAGEDVLEWAEYHLRLGVSRIYLFDTDNPEPSEPFLADLINAGRVEYYYLPRVTPTTVPLMQVRLYQLCLRHAAPRHSFLAFMDMDEFLVLAPGERAAGGLPALLRGFEASPGLAVNWRLLGSSGHATRQGGGVLRSFTACTPADYVENRQVKTIVNTRFVVGTSTDPHHFEYKEGRQAITTGGEAVGGALSARVWSDRISLYHYATKSLEEYQAKMARGSAMGNRKGADFMHRIDAASSETCAEALATCIELGVPSCLGAALPADTAALAA